MWVYFTNSEVMT